MIQTEEYIGKGIYTPRQAARYARLKTATLTRWVHGSSVGASALRPELRSDPDMFVTFLDLIQALAVRAIRLSDKVPLQRIRQVIDIAHEQYEIDYPFARKHTTYLFDDDIVLRLRDDLLIQITGKYKGNQLINEVIETYAEDLVHDDNTGLARRYEPLKYRDRTVVLDPSIRFGEPIVEPCGYTVDVLITAVKTEGNVSRAARAYGVTDDDIKTAQRYDDWILGVAA